MPWLQYNVLQPTPFHPKASSTRVYFTNFTLALAGDSGWYVPDYSLAVEMEWGKGAGCDFATDECEPPVQDSREWGAASHSLSRVVL